MESTFSNVASSMSFLGLNQLLSIMKVSPSTVSTLESTVIGELGEHKPIPT